MPHDRCSRCGVVRPGITNEIRQTRTTRHQFQRPRTNPNNKTSEQKRSGDDLKSAAIGDETCEERFADTLWPIAPSTAQYTDFDHCSNTAMNAPTQFIIIRPCTKVL